MSDLDKEASKKSPKNPLFDPEAAEKAFEALRPRALALPRSGPASLDVDLQAAFITVQAVARFTAEPEAKGEGRARPENRGGLGFEVSRRLVGDRREGSNPPQAAEVGAGGSRDRCRYQSVRHEWSFRRESQVSLSHHSRA